MAIYMKAQGISGSVTAKGHESWIKLDSVNFGVRVPVYTKAGDVRTRVKGTPSLGEVEITKPVDKSSIHLFTRAVESSLIPEVMIHYCRTDDALTMYQSFILKNVLLSEFVEGHDGESAAPREMIRMNFTSIEKSFTPSDSNGSLGAPLKAGYNLETAATL